MNPFASRLAFWTILIVALLLRIAAAVAIDQKVRAEGRQFLIEGDANGYWELGKKIANGEEYSIYTPPRRVLRTPGFPLLLALSIKTFGQSVFAASIVMAVVGTGCCWLTYLLARRFLDEKTSLVAMAIAAVSPIQIGSNVQILSETWFSFWLLLCLVALEPLLSSSSTSLGQGPRRGRSLLCGILTGMTTLVRPGWILWTGLSAGMVLLLGTGSRAKRIESAVLIAIGCFIALLPWAWRNHEVTGHWVFTSLWSGPSLYDGLHPGATGASDMRFVDEETVFSTMSEFDANAHYKQRAFQFAVENPGRTLELAFLKSGRYLAPSLNADGFSGGPFSLFCLAWYFCFATLVVLGALRGMGRVSSVFLLTGPFLQFLLVHMVFVGSIRYRLPVEFPLSVLAAAGLAAIRSGWNPTRDASLSET